MILETIFLWVGGLVLISVLFVILLFLWLKYFDRFWYNVRFSVKAIYYDLVSQWLESKDNDNSYIKQTKMQVGTSWYVRYKGKRYEWECINVEEIKECKEKLK